MCVTVRKAALFSSWGHPQKGRSPPPHPSPPGALGGFPGALSEQGWKRGTGAVCVWAPLRAENEHPNWGGSCSPAAQQGMETEASVFKIFLTPNRGARFWWRLGFPTPGSLPLIFSVVFKGAREVVKYPGPEVLARFRFCWGLLMNGCFPLFPPPSPSSSPSYF